MRAYKMATGHWGLGVHRYSGGWCIEFLCWVFTTEP